MGPTILQRREPALGESTLPLSWAPVLEQASLYRYREEGETRECLRLEATGRARVLRVRIRNRDDRPLEVREVTVMVPQERLAFEAVSPYRYRLTYGDASLEPPVYDVERTVGDAALWIAQAFEGHWEPLVDRVREGPWRPWTDSHLALPLDHGMLFIFEQPDFHAIWMKNCKFPIDIVWLDAQRKVVHVASKVPPCEAEPCPVYQPLQRASFVVELSAGQAAREKAVVGSKLEFTLPPLR